MAETRKCQLLVIGAGPGGYVTGIRAGQLGLDTIVVEGDRAGGTCLIRGCIPSKAIIHAADRFEALRQHSTEGGHMGLSIDGGPEVDMSALVSWKDTIVDKLNKGVEGLLKAAGVELLNGWATFSGPKHCTVETSEGPVGIEAENVVIATGSSHIDLPFMPCDEEFVLSSTGALDLSRLPKKAAIVGGGYIGLELGCALTKLGTEVTVVEGLDSILAIFDKELRRPLEIWLKRHGVTVHTNALARGIEIKGKGASRKVELMFEKEGEEESIKVDNVLVTVGRRPNTKGWGLENMGVRMDASGRFIRIDSQCQTNVPGVFAIGDVSGEPMLAHRASAQGEMVAEIIAGHPREFDKVAIPAIVFTEPEIVSVGLTPSEAEERGEKIVVGKFPLVASGRALTLEADRTGGFVRVTARESDHVILGVQAVGSHVAELHGEFVLALEMGALLEDVAGTVHAHPTITEAFHESVLKTLGHAIHTT
ncbi:MAG: dihydrolipoyl dehydrogenase [Candidatus Thalassarchaeaceae archaeon]|nr:dihydrolipoyl dehydrogenase [Euryarchaeota archaeon]MDP7091472.1 dihydrolipoyl dehydrogenase [Candidatus Thalassarchaeaceae archaeon]MBV43302.1 dihydrolipoyl dehydrogenase [Euryarchaeota archaeon]MDP7257463.1 dihydrolipoyl dehydrogenase [Candidatus Thalassarchaeaceae archaeon]MDP7446294.1 dihydrolipoyl dehydrogenase [Candidatus Thalassarchaeaceae archaeon]